MSNPTPSVMALATLKMPKSKDTRVNSRSSSNTVRCSMFNDAVDEKKNIIVTSQLMDEGPVAAWAGAWYTKELNSKFQHNPTKFVCQNLVSALRDAHTPINITGDAKLGSGHTKIARSVDFTELTILMCSARPRKRLVRHWKNVMAGRSCSFDDSISPYHSHPCHMLHPSSLPPRTEPLATATTVTAADQCDSTGAMYGDQGT